MKSNVHQTVSLFLLFVVSNSVFAEDAKPVLKTWDGNHDISQINVLMVYFVPKDREVLKDWKNRLSYYSGRIESFHQREFNGQSRLTTFVHREPFRSKLTTEELREGDANKIFFRTLREVDTSLNGDLRKKDGFPIILVMSEINWRPLDDFYRLNPDGKFEGNINREGRHFPGAKSGGARAVYLSRQGIGWGLVSADGWRVPYSGSDCVVYHEGVGHPIGLPHPDPIDRSVMGTGQYHYWISQTNVNREQKLKLGWKPPEQEPKANDLFSSFTAIPSPDVPKPGETVSLNLTWPENCQLSEMTIETQLALNEPWDVVHKSKEKECRQSIVIGTFKISRPVSYRVRATLTSGEQVELWGYFQVREKRNEPPRPEPT